jgi:hypothetical protein
MAGGEFEAILHLPGGEVHRGKREKLGAHGGLDEQWSAGDDRLRSLLPQAIPCGRRIARKYKLV